jgi:hypothetical protein
VKHPGEVNVRRVFRLAPRPGERIHAFRRAADRLERAGRPLLERVLLDDDPLLGELPLDFLLGANQSRQVLIASSIRG